MTERDDMLYVARGRFPCRRANLIQSLRTTSALTDLGFRVRVALPPSRGSVDIAAELKRIGIKNPPRIECFKSLHPRWSFWPFPLFHGDILRSAGCIYTRVVDVSRLLIKRGIEHHLEIHDTEGLLASGVIEELVAAHKDGVLRTLVPISHSAAGIFVEHGAVVERIHVAPSGVDLSQFEGLAPFDPERLAAPRVLHAGSLAADRGEAVLQAVAARGVCSVTIVGRVENEVDGAVMHAPVAPAEVPALYGECDLVLVPYQSDLPRALTMSPVKIFEAMAAGRPIIASSLPTIREVLRHESNALIVPPNDMAAWMSAIERLRGDPELAVRLANQAKMDAGQYSWEERAKGLSKAIGMHRQPV